MKLILTSLLLFAVIQNRFIPPNYRIKYHLTYKPDSTNLKRVSNEKFLLFVKPNVNSFYASENFLKKDSISALIQKGTLSDGDIMADSRNRFKTRFPQFINKDYARKTARFYETIGLHHYTYTIPVQLNWQITAKHDTIAGYLCTKATTTYAGRHFEAWFTPEIPVSDGPYVFNGLPGLIVKLNDTRNHYTFILEQLNQYTGKITEEPTYRKQQPISIDRTKAFTLREELRKDAWNHLNRTTGNAFEGATFQRHGSSTTMPLKSAMPDRSWDNNPLELK